MNNLKDIRWEQRFDNYKKAYKLLERIVDISNPSEAEKGGLIQFYEMGFELAWKLQKDYLEFKGYTAKSPSETIKQAFQSEIISNGHVWIDALDDRNLATHTYDEKIADKVLKRIKEDYYPVLRALYQFLKRELDK